MFTEPGWLAKATGFYVVEAVTATDPQMARVSASNESLPSARPEASDVRAAQPFQIKRTCWRKLSHGVDDQNKRGEIAENSVSPTEHTKPSNNEEADQ